MTKATDAKMHAINTSFVDGRVDAEPAGDGSHLEPLAIRELLSDAVMICFNHSVRYFCQLWPLIEAIGYGSHHGCSWSGAAVVR